MSEEQKISALEQRVTDLEASQRQMQKQLLDMSELVGKQSSLIVTLSSQQAEDSRITALVRNAVRTSESSVDPAS